MCTLETFFCCSPTTLLGVREGAPFVKKGLCAVSFGDPPPLGPFMVGGGALPHKGVPVGGLKYPLGLWGRLRVNAHEPIR